MKKIIYHVQKYKMLMKDVLVLDIQQFILIYPHKSQLSHKHFGILSHTHLYVNGTLPTVSIKTTSKKTTFC